MKKRGITLLVLMMAIVVMTILISTAAVIGSGSIISANFEEYKSKITRMSNDVNAYYLQNGSLPATNETVSAESFGTEFLNSVVNNGDSQNKLYVIDISKISDATIKLGKGTIKNKDVFVVAENTQNIYYLGGYKYKGKVYFSSI